MTTEKKLVLATSLLPVLADILEDVPLNQIIKFKANTVINSIRALDNYFINQSRHLPDSRDAWIEQNELQLKFREFLNNLDLGI
jgi:hypothetical protein